MLREEMVSTSLLRDQRPLPNLHHRSVAALTDRPILLTAIGMVAASVALWLYAQAMPMFVDEDIFDFSRVIKPPLYYVAHAATILSMCGAGMIALYSTESSVLRRYGASFLLFLAAGALMTIRGYSLPAAMSTQIVSSTGPFVCIVSLLIFVGAQSRNWDAIDKLFLSMAAVYSVLSTVQMLGLESVERFDAALALTSFLNVLFWPAVWILLRPCSLSSSMCWLRYGPIALYAIGSILTQTRLNWVMILAALSFHARFEKQRKTGALPKLLFGAGVALWLVLFAVKYQGESKYVQALEVSGEAFITRWDEDTRTNQLIQFFTNVHLSELVLGRGALATWNWNGIDWGGGTDIGYLTLLFFGGIPLLVSYVIVHIRPAFRAFRRPQSEWQQCCGALVLLWALRMFSSSYPGLGVDYYPVLLCVGGCMACDWSGRSAMPRRAARYPA